MTKSREEYIADFVAEQDQNNKLKDDIFTALSSIDESNTSLINELHDIILATKPDLPS